MRKTVLLSALLATALFATNGDNMIGIGTESRALGGTGVAMNVGTDSVFRNPAWLVDIDGFNATFGGTLFMPDVHASVGPQMFGNGQETKSDADLSLIPSVSHTSHITDDLSFGVGMFGVSGMGVDYRNQDPRKGLGNMRTSLQYLRFVPSLSYKYENWRIGGGITLAYGMLNLSAVMPSVTAQTPQQMQATAQQRGGGQSEDFGFGFQLGVGYYVMPNLTLGAYYQSKISTTYEKAFDFNTDGVYDDLKLDQPAEYGIGIGYTMAHMRMTFDYRRIAWSDADGYDTFEWDDQDVFAFGLGYQADEALELRVGYNYATSPLHDKTFVGSPAFPAAKLAYFNTLGFPAYSDAHYTFGLGYQLNKSVGIDLSYVYAPKVTESTSIYGLEASNEQNSLSVGLRFSY